MSAQLKEEPGTRTQTESIAVSLKRIADVAELFAISLLTDHRKQEQGHARLGAPAWVRRPVG